MKKRKEKRRVKKVYVCELVFSIFGFIFFSFFFFFIVCVCVWQELCNLDTHMKVYDDNQRKNRHVIEEYYQ